MGAALVNSASQAMQIMARWDDQSVFSAVTRQQESREAVANVLHGRMAARVAAHLEDCRAQGIADRRNGSHTHRVLTTPGDLELEVPRTRTFNPSGLPAAFQLGLSTRKAARTTNAIERCFVEIRRRTRPMGVMADRTSCERIVYAVFTGINQAQGTASPSP